jgi:4-amino-4-deoxy-L-arabinose transferase-like glycosyltransferase
LSEARLARLTRGDTLAWLLCLAFVLCTWPLLATRHYNFDEGVYIHQARLMMDGQWPYVDFFYHQTPLYLFTLAAFTAPAAGSIVASRLLSVLATAICGFFVYRIALRLLPKAGALLAVVLFLTPPVQFYGLLALPNALMVLFSTAAVYLVCFQKRPELLVLGAVLLVASILYKPLSVSTGIAVGIVLVWVRGERSKVGPVLLAGAVAGLGAWGLFEVLSDGIFTEVLKLQALRYSDKAGFELMSAYEGFRRDLGPLGIESAIDWNLYELGRVFLSPSNINSTTALAGLAAAGQLLLWSSHGRRWAGQRMLLWLWWFVPLVFFIFVWEPIWDHYFVQILPPLAILAALVLVSLWDLPKVRVPARAFVVIVLLYAMALGPLHFGRRRIDYAGVPQGKGETWLTFDPYFHLMTESEPACGIIDPFNVYGEWSLPAISPAPVWSAYRVSSQDLIDCLVRNPEIRVGLGFWGVWFVDDTLRSYLDQLPAERFVFEPRYLDESSRSRKSLE